MTVELSKELLLSVRKPARYIGGEVGAIKKDLSKMAVTVCLCFPDIYEIGMSHLGLRILYDIINKREDCAAERVFSPWVDMEEQLKANRIPLFSLESRVPVRDFDILGFSIQYELSYTNVLNVLRLSGIPLRSRERSADDPLVIAGGASCLNPEPMAEFIDCFIIGEAEEVLIEFIEVYKRHQTSGQINRQALLKELSSLEGVYVPSFCEEVPSFKISKRIVKDLEKAWDLNTWVVPYIEIVHDRIGIEIMRGCPNRCRFCQARSHFYPFRIMSPEKILETVRRLYRKTGYEEISLLSLSSSDYPYLKTVIKDLTDEFVAKGVSISLPSLRAGQLVGELPKMLANMKKTSLTFAPEAGSERLRQMMHKDIDIEELFQVARAAFSAGYRLLKLYFMIGLPTETNEDLDQIRDICVKLSACKREFGGPPAQLNVTISNFIPKSHTPFERQAMASREELSAKQGYLKDIFHKYKGTIHLKFHDIRASYLEAMLARGGRELSIVISDCFEKGVKFDAWDEFFNFGLWEEAFRQNAIDPDVTLVSRSPSQKLPWDFIDVGIPLKE